MVVVRLLIYFAFIAVSSNYVDSRIIRIKKPETPTFDFSKYHGFPQFEQYLRNVASMNPAFVELREIGKTHQGRSLLGVKVRQFKFIA
ncbi:hypothetical protein AB6A40_007484 [Gnathostoma spinigerum]|uniref:Peptidase M14 domain-containing protein n=1 Tax=Gnathostoma spinigerum TaxID=75299 RepID=A0ABD6EWZ0_9BILA